MLKRTPPSAPKPAAEAAASALPELSAAVKLFLRHSCPKEFPKFLIRRQKVGRRVMRLVGSHLQQEINAAIGMVFLRAANITPAAQRSEYRELRDAALRMIKALGHTHGTNVLGRGKAILLYNRLVLTARAVNRAMESTSVRKGPRSPQKHEAALRAYQLLRTSGTTPTLSEDGPFFELAKLLYEGGTGIVNADLSRACRQVFHQLRIKLADE
jgi:hypothetical protein